MKLADRCELEKPSWDLDVSIECALAGRSPPTEVFTGYQPTPYTTSIDAALTLVPEGWRARNMDTGDPSLKYAPPSADLIPLDSNDAGWVVHGEKRPLGQARTLALAICAAALKVRSAL